MAIVLAAVIAGLFLPRGASTKIENEKSKKVLISHNQRRPT